MVPRASFNCAQTEAVPAKNTTTIRMADEEDFFEVEPEYEDVAPEEEPVEEPEDEDAVDAEAVEAAAAEAAELRSGRGAPPPATAIVSVVPRHERRGSDMLTVPEVTRLLGARAQLLAQDRRVFAPEAEGLGAIEAAKAELRARRFPLLLERTMSRSDTESIVEIWDPNEMIHPDVF